MRGPLRKGAGQGILAAGPAIGLLEVRSIARGILAADALVKKAQVTLALVRPVSPGKHLTLCTGQVAEVKEAMAAGRAVAGSALCDELILAQAHDDVLLALHRGGDLSAYRPDSSLGIVETFSAAAAILAADSACKGAEVRLLVLRLCDGLGGKGYFVMSGEQDMIEAALLEAERVTVPGLFLARELIARPHEDLVAALLRED